MYLTFSIFMFAFEIRPLSYIINKMKIVKVESFLIVSNLLLISSAPSFNVKSDPKDATTFDEFNIPWDGENYSFGYLSSQGQFRMEKGYWVTAPNGIMFLMVVGAYTKISYDNHLQVIEYYSDLNGYHEKLGMPLERYLIDTKIQRPQPTTTSKPIESFTITTPYLPPQTTLRPSPVLSGTPILNPPDLSLLGNYVMGATNHEQFGNTLAKLLAKKMRKLKRAVLIQMTFDFKNE